MSQRFFRIFAPAAFLFFIPLLFFGHQLDELHRHWNDLDRATRSEKAAEILGDLERSMDLAVIVKESFERFCREIGRSLSPPSLASAPLSIFDRRFRRRFPRQSVLLWFDAGGRFLPQPDVALPVRSTRSWQAFFEVLLPPENLAHTSLRIAEGLIKTLFGEFLSIEILRSGREAPVKVFLQTEMHFFLYAPIPATDGKTTGWLLAFIPLDRARPGWELRRAVKRAERLRTPEPIEFGGFWLSESGLKGEGDCTPGISPGLAQGIWSQRLHTTTLGTSTPGLFSADHELLLLGKLAKNNPDVFLLVGIRGSPSLLRTMVSLIPWAQQGLIGLGGFVGVLCFGFFLGLRFPELRLATQFRLISGVLALLPLLAVSLAGVSHFVRHTQIQHEESLRELDGILDQIEQSVAEQLAALEEKFRRHLLRIEDWADGAPHRLNAVWRSLKRTYALENLLFIPRNEDMISIGHAGNHAIVQIFSSMILDRLQFGRRKNKTRKTQLEGMQELFERFTPDDFRATLNRFQFMATGATQKLAFHAFCKDNNQDNAAYFSLFFDQNALLQILLERAQKRFPARQRAELSLLHLHSRDDSEAGNHQVLSPQFQSWLNSTQYSEKPLSSRVTRDGRTTQYFCRPLKNLGTIGLVGKELRTLQATRSLTLGFLVLLFLLSTATAAIVSRLLEQYLLTPVLVLARAVEQVDRGATKTRVTHAHTDELGQLLGTFNELAAGLEEKERMSPFLHQALVQSVHQQAPERVARHDVVILFAGLRDFLNLERSLSPRAAMAVMSHFLGLCEQTIVAEGGDVNKFIGDTVLAVFQAQGDTPPETRAVKAAQAIQHQVQLWMQERREAGLPEVVCGIGIASGIAVLGQVGAAHKRLDFTVIGDVVNLAARLEKMAGRPGQPTILVDGATRRQAAAISGFAPTEITSVRGRAGRLEVFGLVS
jgi:class 3 adenylate cyclase